MTKTAELRMKRMQIADLKPAPYNPRTITEVAKAGLSKSISEFGLVEPIIWNERTGHVVGGHQRLDVLLDQGVTETDVVVVDLEEAREKMLNVALNNQLIAGAYDDDGLSGLLAEILTTEDEALFKSLRMDEITFSVEDEPIHGIGEEEDKRPQDVVITMRFTPETWVAARSGVLVTIDRIQEAYNCKFTVNE